VIRFTAVIEAANRGGAVIVVPDELVSALGGGGRIAVRAEFDGIPYRGSVVTYSGRRVLGVLKAIRDELGKGPGDMLEVGLDPDLAERVVEIPPELTAAFEEVPGSRAAFENLSYSHRREHVEHITGAKRPDTRHRRARKTAESLGDF
jgi:hypothetical protein